MRECGNAPGFVADNLSITVEGGTDHHPDQSGWVVWPSSEPMVPHVGFHRDLARQRWGGQGHHKYSRRISQIVARYFNNYRETDCLTFNFTFSLVIAASPISLSRQGFLILLTSKQYTISLFFFHS